MTENFELKNAKLSQPVVSDSRRNKIRNLGISPDILESVSANEERGK